LFGSECVKKSDKLIIYLYYFWWIIL